MNRDWVDVLEAMRQAGARFLVVGAHAMAVHGVPRGTQDLDLWVDATPENAAKVWRALAEFGAPLEALRITVDDFTLADHVVQLGLAPNRIDILTSLSGIDSFDGAWARRTAADLGGDPVPVIGLVDLTANKRASGRMKDLADLEALGAR